MYTEWLALAAGLFGSDSAGWDILVTLHGVHIQCSERFKCMECVVYDTVHYETI